MQNLMPRTKTWTHEGVTLTFLTYDTQRKLRVRDLLWKDYRYADPTDESPENYSVPTPVYLFYAAMPCLLSVSGPDILPVWAEMLKAMLEAPLWLSDPVKDYQTLDIYAPDNLLMDCYEGFKATREMAYTAPPELQETAPLPPEAYGIFETGAEHAANPTLSDTTPGTASTTSTFSPTFAPQPVAARRKAK